VRSIRKAFFHDDANQGLGRRARTHGAKGLSKMKGFEDMYLKDSHVKRQDLIPILYGRLGRMFGIAPLTNPYFTMTNASASGDGIFDDWATYTPIEALYMCWDWCEEQHELPDDQLVHPENRNAGEPIIMVHTGADTNNTLHDDDFSNDKYYNDEGCFCYDGGSEVGTIPQDVTVADIIESAQFMCSDTILTLYDPSILGDWAAEGSTLSRSNSDYPDAAYARDCDTFSDIDQQALWLEKNPVPYFSES